MEPISDVMELFRHQRAVRAWSDRPVPEEVVRQVVEAATHGPSGSNSQPWRFIVIRDPEVKEQLSALYEEGMELAKQCQGLLDGAELRITKLRESFAQPAAPQEGLDGEEQEAFSLDEG